MEMSFITKLPKKRLSDLKAGESLAARTGYSIAELIEKATKDRFQFAISIHAQARRAIQGEPAAYRLATGRAYYAMYHAFRAVIYYTTEGDDNEAHSELPRHIPRDFPRFSYWENVLKNARLERNRADYDPYPTRDLSFRESAITLLGQSKILLPLIRNYMKGKGLIL